MEASSRTADLRNLGAWTIALRPLRAELVGLALVMAGGLAFVGGIAVRLAAFGLPRDCFTVAGTATDACGLRAVDLAAYLDIAGSWGGSAYVVVTVLIVVCGVVLGLSLVGRDIEQRTTEFAWSVIPSRRRWLATRTLPALLGLVVAAGVSGILGDWLEALRQPAVDPQRSFEGFGYRGPVLAGLALASTGAALLVSSVVGRVLPALLIAGVLACAAVFGVTAVSDTLLQHESVVVVEGEGREPGRALESLIRTPQGEILTFAEAYERYGSAAVDEMDPALGLTLMVRIVPARIYPIAAWRLAVLYGFLGISALTGTFAVVERRRP